MGREQWFLTPKDGISLLGIRSKIERQGVRKEGEVLPLLFSFTLRRGRCSCGGSADSSSLYKCAVLLRNIRILIENILFK